MRIQHNIPAMTAYRNYVGNNSLLSKNLEKLSSGYKINRAGDDAAGLAISEKMRAQITGLEVAQKNAKDGIGLVQTAEGALAEVHDMLNRMYALSEQSANGIYSSSERSKLQAEVDQLCEEIDRIADSTNFNGIKLLDGTLAGSGGTSSTGGTSGSSSTSSSSSTSAASGVLAASFKLDARDTANQVQSTRLTLEFSIATGATSVNRGVGSSFALTFGTKGGAGSYAALTIKATTALKDIGSLQFGSATFAGSTVKIKDLFDIEINGKKFSLASWGAQTIASAGRVAGSTGSGAGTIHHGSGVTYTVKLIAKTAGYLGSKVDNTIGKFSNIKVVEYGMNGGDGSTTKATYNFSADVSKLQGGDTISIGNKVLKIKAEDLLKIQNASTATKAYTEASKVFAANAFGSGLSRKLFIGGSEGAWTLNVTYETTKAGADYDKGAMRVALANSITEGRSATNRNDPNSTIGDINFRYLEGRNALSDDNFARLDYNLGYTDEDGDFQALHIKDLTASANAGDEIHIGNYKIIITATETNDNTGRISIADAKNATNLANHINQFLVNRGFNSAKVGVTQIASSNNAGDRLEIKGFTSGEKADDLEKTIGEVKYLTKAQLDEMRNISSSSSGSSGTSGSTGGSSSTTKGTGGLRLQIGDDAESYNQLDVQIKSIKTSALFSSGKPDLTAGGTNDNATAQAASTQAMKDIKSAIEYVSEVRGTLGATQNRLEHTINNLSVARENIQDAESTIRDTDVAEEMMKYTKNSILNQSAQAMLAQANQLPQGVLQLLG